MTLMLSLGPTCAASVRRSFHDAARPSAAPPLNILRNHERRSTCDVDMRYLLSGPARPSRLGDRTERGRSRLDRRVSNGVVRPSIDPKPRRKTVHWTFIAAIADDSPRPREGRRHMRNVFMRVDRAYSARGRRTVRTGSLWACSCFYRGQSSRLERIPAPFSTGLLVMKRTSRAMLALRSGPPSRRTVVSGSQPQKTVWSGVYTEDRPRPAKSSSAGTAPTAMATTWPASSRRPLWRARRSGKSGIRRTAQAV